MLGISSQAAKAQLCEADSPARRYMSPKSSGMRGMSGRPAIQVLSSRRSCDASSGHCAAPGRPIPWSPNGSHQQLYRLLAALTHGGD